MHIVEYGVLLGGGWQGHSYIINHHKVPAPLYGSNAVLLVQLQYATTSVGLTHRRLERVGMRDEIDRHELRASSSLPDADTILIGYKQRLSNAWDIASPTMGRRSERKR
jgi:hypothetical protein